MKKSGSRLNGLPDSKDKRRRMDSNHYRKSQKPHKETMSLTLQNRHDAHNQQMCLLLTIACAVQPVKQIAGDKKEPSFQ
jgi:hypothetical protein